MLISTTFITVEAIFAFANFVIFIILKGTSYENEQISESLPKQENRLGLPKQENRLGVLENTHLTQCSHSIL